MSVKAKARRDFVSFKRLLAKLPKDLAQADYEHHQDIHERIYSLTRDLSTRLDTIENAEEQVPGFGLALVDAISAVTRSASSVDLLSALMFAAARLTPSDDSRLLAAALVRGDHFAVLARYCASVATGAEPDGDNACGSSGSADSGAGGSGAGLSGTGAGCSAGRGSSNRGSGSLAVAIGKLGSCFVSCTFVLTHTGKDMEIDRWAELRGALRRSSFLEHAAAALLRTAAAINCMQQQEQQQQQHKPEQQQQQPEQPAGQADLLWRLHAAVSVRFMQFALLLTGLNDMDFDELCASTRRYRPEQVIDVDSAARQAACAAEVRELVSGPGLRALLFAVLTSGQPNGGDAAVGGPAASMRICWPEKAVTASDLTVKEAQSITLQVAARVFQATVSGKHGALPVAQPPLGYVNTGLLSCWLDEGQQSPLSQPQQPQSQNLQQGQGKEGGQQQTSGEQRVRTAEINAAVAVHFVAAAHATARVTQHGTDVGGGFVAVSKTHWARAAPSLRLLVRLLPEMSARQAVGHLPGLWRRLVAALPRLLEAEVVENDAMGLLADAGLLLRLHIDRRGQPLAMPPQQGPAAAGAAAGAAAAPQPGTGPGFSLRLALEAGLLPALERLLRAAFVERPAAATAAVLAGGKGRTRQEALEENARIATCAVGCLLQTSGVFPALLAHAPVEELVPLLATLARVQRQLAAVGDALLLHRKPRFQTIVPGAGVSSTLPAAAVWLQSLTALAQQVRVVSEWAALAPPQTPRPPVINMRLEAFRVDVRWLAAAGGAPPPGSAAAAQQRQMQSLMCLWWAPEAAELHSKLCRPWADTLPELLALVEETREALHMQLHVCRARARAYLAHDIACEKTLGPGSGTGAGSGNGSQAGGAGGVAGADSETVAVKALWMETVVDEWRSRVAGTLLGMQRQYEVAARLLCDKAMLAAAEAEARGEAAQGVASSAGAACSAAGGGMAAGGDGGSVGGGSGSGDEGFRHPTARELLASTATALLDMVEQDILCAALLRPEQPAAAKGPAAGAASGGIASAAPLPYVLVSAAVRAVLYEFGGLGQRPVEALLLPLQPRTSAGDEETEEERVWICSFLEPAEAGSRQVMVEQLREAEAAAGRLLPSAIDQYAARAVEEVEAADLQQRQRHRESVGDELGGLAATLGPERVACAVLAEAAERRQAAAVPLAAGARTADAPDVQVGGLPVPRSLVCYNPGCSSLEGPSALVAPGCGKTCVRCKAVTYCCGACQLAHWGAAAGGHSRVCPKLVALLAP